MTRFEPSRLFRLANRTVAPLIRMGVPMGPERAALALLTVTGRKSGTPRTTPIALARHDGGFLLIAVYGICDWSRNLEAAGEGSITMRGETIRVTARRLHAAEAGAMLRDAMLAAPGMIRRMTSEFFTADEGSSLEDWQHESVHHPVFVLRPRVS